MPKVPRNVLKQYFETGDMPTQAQFAVTLDSMVNFTDDRDFIGLRSYKDSNFYEPGDCVVFANQVLQCNTATTGAFKPTDWTVLSAFGSVNYVSSWDTQNNLPPLQSGVGTKGFYYVVTNASPDPNLNTELDGIDNWGTGDWAIFNGVVWQKVDNSQAPVEAVNVSYVPSGDLLATNVQDAIDELEIEKQPLISVKNPYIPYAISTSKLAESWLARAEDGVTIDLRKLIRSERQREAQIDFGSGGDEINLTTSGSDPVESRLLMSPTRTTLQADGLDILASDAKAGINIKPGGNITLYNDGLSGTDGELRIQPQKVELYHGTLAGVVLSPGSDFNGETLALAGGNSLQITRDKVILRNTIGPGASLLLDSSGVFDVQSNELNLNSTQVYVDSLSPSAVVVTDANQVLTSSAVTSTELGNLSGVTSPVQTQLNNKLNTSGGTMTGPLVLNADPTAALEAATMQYVDNGDASLQTQVNTKVSKAGDAMTGLLTLSADPVAALGAVTKQYADAIQALLNATKVNRGGDTMTGPLVLSADPTAALEAATMQYVDNGDASLLTQVNAKVSKAGDAMTGLLTLSADPVAALGAVTKQYADAIQALLTTTKVEKSGDTMTGLLVLSGDPATALGAATKQYVDAADATLTTAVNSKVAKGGDTMTGLLVLSGDPAAALGAATKQYVDAATKKILLPFTFNNDFATNSGTFTGIPLQVIIPDPATVFPGATTVTAKLTIDFMTESGPTPAEGEAGLTEWTTATSGSPSLISGSAIAMPATSGVWTKATTTSAFTVAGNRSYRVIFRKTAGSGGAQVRIESAILSLFFS